MKIAFVLSQPPAYSETFLRAKIKGLQKNGLDVTLYCRKEQKDFDLCPLVLMPRVSKNPVVQLWLFLRVFLELIRCVEALCGSSTLNKSCKKKYS